jgi:hypothetical protein
MEASTRRAISYRRDHSVLAELAMFGARTWLFGASTAARHPVLFENSNWQPVTSYRSI